MSEWKKCAIGNMVTLRQGFAINAKSKHYISKEPTSLALLRIADMKSGSREIFVKEDIPQKYIALPQDIVYTRTGNVGLVFRNNFGVVHNNCFTVTPNDEKTLSRDYLYYILQSKYFYEKANSLARGAAQPDLPHSLFNSIEISYPELDCQYRISTILSHYDSLIENYQKQIKLLEEAAQRLYKEWFVDLRFPGHENTKIINGVPEGWEKKSVSQLGDYINGFAFKPSDWQKTGKPIIKIKEMGNGVSDETPRNDGERVPNKYGVKVGDLLFSWSATLMVIVWTGEEGWLNQHLFKVIPAIGIGREFLLQSISNAIAEFSNLTTGSTMKHIQRNKLDQVFVNTPSANIMEKYNTIAETARKQIINLSHQIRLLSEARDRMLSKLMSGEISV